MEDDVAALSVPQVAKPAGAVALLLGVFGCLLAAQTFVIVVAWWAALLAGVMLVLGIAAAGAGYRMTRGSAKAAMVAVIAAAGSALLALGWFGFSLWHGVFSPLAGLVVMLSLAATILSALAKPDLQRVEQARSRLREQGLDLGL